MSQTESTPPREWIHSRKGRIVGRVVREDEDWLTIELDGDHLLTYVSEAERGRIDHEGDCIVFRKSLLTEVTR